MIVLGNNIILTSRKLSKSATGGFRTLTEYAGTRDAVEGYAFQLPEGLDWAIDDSDTPKCRLIVSAPYLDAGNTTAEAPTDVWDMPGTASLKDIYEQKLSLALGASMLSAVKRGVEIATSGSGATAFTDGLNEINLASTTTTSDADKQSAADLFYGIIRGTTHYQVSQYVLRHTKVAGQNSTIPLNYDGVGEVYSVAQIYNEDPIPGDILDGINQIVAPDVQAGYTWGWLKQAPSKKVPTGGRVEAVTEWILEQWWNRLYPNH